MEKQKHIEINLEKCTLDTKVQHSWLENNKNTFISVYLKS